MGAKWLFKSPTFWDESGLSSPTLVSKMPSPSIPNFFGVQFLVACIAGMLVFPGVIDFLPGHSWPSFVGVGGDIHIACRAAGLPGKAGDNPGDFASASSAAIRFIASPKSTSNSLIGGLPLLCTATAFDSDGASDDFAGSELCHRDFSPATDPS